MRSRIQLLGLVLTIMFSFIIAESDNSSYYSDYKCNTPLLRNAFLKATTHIKNRGPENAILNGPNTWTAAEIDFVQRLIIDLGNVMNITSIATQGHPDSPEYVRQFYVSYSVDGLNYTDYKDLDGDLKLFMGNSDGNTIKINNLEIPIVTQWIRIHPFRWRNRISLRLELYGCEYASNTLYINGSSFDISFDNKCDPNPCKHNGICHQTSEEFTCDCINTGYTGAICHTPIHPLSCQAYKNSHNVNQRENIKIDLDGSGPLDPFPVTCEFHDDGRVLTIVRHNYDNLTTTVDGFQEPGSFKQHIKYNANMKQLGELLKRSHTCRQQLLYTCYNSRLFNSPSDDQTFRPFAWWVSRHNRRMNYWPGAIPGSLKCQCGIEGNCVDPNKWCNCDSRIDGWEEDGGDITEKDHLPVRRLQFGDTGNLVDDKKGKSTLGPLICEGDDLFYNVVTFQNSNSTINLPTFDIGLHADIYFEFKTKSKNGVLIHSNGVQDNFKISLLGEYLLQFQYEAGNGPMDVNIATHYKLSNNKWHSVSIERNGKAVRIVIDSALSSETHEPPGPVLGLQLMSPLVLGATVNHQDGYVGCMRTLLLNGQPQDLSSYAEKGLYGIRPGCTQGRR